MLKLAIIHFSPVEMYPPVMNWLNFLAAKNHPGLEVRVFTSLAPERFSTFNLDAGSIRLIRRGKLNTGSSISRYWNYAKFYSLTSLDLAIWRPDQVMYYETVSAGPAILYKRLFNRSSRLMIHYHEYMSTEEYQESILLNRWQHRLEKKTYQHAVWISHTNAERLNYFLAENKNIGSWQGRLLPNYPPYSWKSSRSRTTQNDPLKIIYIGALSLDTMYTREFAAWVLAQKGSVTWHIYSSNATPAAKEFIATEGKGLIHFFEGVDYFALPELLNQFDVGIVLYKGHIPNYVYNEPNKLFEYLACTLDAWIPDGLKVSTTLLNRSSWPKVISVDFSDLSSFDWRQAINRDGLPFKLSAYYCEDVLETLWNTIQTTGSLPMALDKTA